MALNISKMDWFIIVLKGKIWPDGSIFLKRRSISTSLKRSNLSMRPKDKTFCRVVVMSVCAKVNIFLSMTELQLLHSQSTCLRDVRTTAREREKGPLHNVNSTF